MHSTAPEALPAEREFPLVTFDLKLGQDFAAVDFNYDAYISYLRHEHELTKEQIAETRIHIVPEDPSSKYTGLYSPDKKLLTIWVSNSLGEHYAADTLRHETSHRVDHAKGGDPRQPDYQRYEELRSRMQMASIGGMLLTIERVGTAVSGNKKAVLGALGAAVLSASFFGASRWATKMKLHAYANDPFEERAWAEGARARSGEFLELIARESEVIAA